MEWRLLLATIAHRFRLRVQDGSTPQTHPGVTLRPAGGLVVTVAVRQ